MHRQVTTVAVALLVLASGRSARAGDPADLATARRLFAEVLVDERKERWDLAREKLLRIVAIKETGGVRYHLARAEERLGLYRAALADFRRAAELVDALPKAEADDLRRRAAEETSSLEERAPRLVVTAPEGAAVSIDGASVPLAEARRGAVIDPGERLVRVVADGRAIDAKLLVVDRRTYPVAFEPEVAPPAAPATTPAPPADTPPRERPRPQPSRTPLLVAGGATAAFALTAGYFGWRWHRLRGETDDVCRDNPRCDPRREDVIDRYRAVTLGAGALAVVGAGVTLYLGVRDTRVGAGPHGVVVGRRF